ncbi:TRAF family member-associated NF-kappa-B activator [Coregonus clupeaformis]|uniref:TRAF family member-associated NF-kappa-B activator n=1 Tax=Coregonus clupeaformis TaxID=59861 RepID=UPI001BE0A243|nr:TRAF family member-associated NF-kappa-B activator [Coregonus clupeaformis]
MERNIGDQLNKAFEAYRQASIERDSAKRELQQTNEYYERHTQKLQKQIEDQQQLISKLKVQLISATKQPSGEVKGEAVPRKQEEETLPPSNHLFDNPVSSFRKIHYLKGNMETAVIVSPSPHTAPVDSSFENKDVLAAFQALQGKFQQIQTLTRRQKDHLKRFYRGNDMANEQQFSMPIQCTDVTAELAERPFPSASALRPGVDLQHPPTALASRGASQEDLLDSLNRLSVKFPPSTDSEYEFLNSAPEKHFDLSMPRKRPAVSSIPAVIVEPSMELAIPFLYPTSPSHPTSPSTSLSHESVCGPQKPLWSPELCDATAVAAAAQAVSAKPQQQINNNSPDICAYCNAVVPQDHMKSHLFTHCQRASEASNRH